ncbi:MAG: hypothetical protein MZU97_20730 [Bacillus subtilis]|nr:hypothetical protein [Bacillus subtilis]
MTIDGDDHCRASTRSSDRRPATSGSASPTSTNLMKYDAIVIMPDNMSQRTLRPDPQVWGEARSDAGHGVRRDPDARTHL